MMKGITPIIAIILLLMITIAMVGFAFIWFTQVSSDLTGNITQQSTEQQRQMQTNLKIENAVNDPVLADTLTLRNKGTVNILLSEVSLYVNDVSKNSELNAITGCETSAVIAPGSTLECSAVGLLDDCSTAGAKIRVTTVGTGDEISCP